MPATGRPAKRPRENGDAGEHKYLPGFGAYLSSEAIVGALPERGNTPQQCPFGLYAEQLSGTSFTKTKHGNQRSWMYRILPAVAHGKWTELDTSRYPMLLAPETATPVQLRWQPLPAPTTRKTFVDGLVCYSGAGEPEMKAGLRIYLYYANANMENSSFCSSDGDMLIVPEHGTLEVTTEFGKMTVPSGFFCVVQRGIRFAVDLPASGARGYVCEVFDNHFELPPMGCIGANGLANIRDFEHPTAAYEDRTVAWTCYQKYCGKMFSYAQDHSPFDVVAWHGNYVPYRYDLNKFCAINSVTFDHLDPSIFAVLTAPTGEPGVASCDFVIFPPRWMVAEKTFRPPYYHKNVMAEFMGNIRGTYEAKLDGFLPGGGSLHSAMAGHGPEAAVFEKASVAELGPVAPQHDALAFMFESHYVLKLTSFARDNLVDKDYQHCWEGIKKHFVPPKDTPA